MHTLEAVGLQLQMWTCLGVACAWDLLYITRIHGHVV